MEMGSVEAETLHMVFVQGVRAINIGLLGAEQSPLIMLAGHASYSTALHVSSAG